MATLFLELATFYLGLATLFLGLATFFLENHFFQNGYILVPHPVSNVLNTPRTINFFPNYLVQNANSSDQVRLN